MARLILKAPYYKPGHTTRKGQSRGGYAEYIAKREGVTEQLKAWETGQGYFYWTYKMLLDPTNDANWVGWDCWDLAKSVDLGWFPEHV